MPVFSFPLFLQPRNPLDVSDREERMCGLTCKSCGEKWRDSKGEGSLRLVVLTDAHQSTRLTKKKKIKQPQA